MYIRLSFCITSTNINLKIIKYILYKKLSVSDVRCILEKTWSRKPYSMILPFRAEYPSKARWPQLKPWEVTEENPCLLIFKEDHKLDLCLERKPIWLVMLFCNFHTVNCHDHSDYVPATSAGFQAWGEGLAPSPQWAIWAVLVEIGIWISFEKQSYLNSQ